MNVMIGRHAGNEPERPRIKPETDFYSHAVRNRILLYLEGLGLDEITGLEIAVECLRRTGLGADPARAMDELAEVLREKGIATGFGPDGVRSFPDMNRRSMVSRMPVDSSLAGGVRRVWTRLLGRGLAADAGRSE